MVCEAPQPIARWSRTTRFRARPLSGGRIRWRTIREVLADPHLRLDYLFVPAQFAGRVMSCAVEYGNGARDASDHFPLVADLRL